jgi:predicted MFS family arabinose efflux permease
MELVETYSTIICFNTETNTMPMYFRIGRKKVFFIAIALQIFSGATMAIAPNWQTFALLRIGVGFAHPGIFVIAVVIGTIEWAGDRCDWLRVARFPKRNAKAVC